jgi:hypothetical protein
MTIQKPITLQEAKSIARHKGALWPLSRELPRWDESTACYAVDLEDAVKRAIRI